MSLKTTIKIFYCNKYRGVASLLSPLSGSILDVGARDRILHSFLKGSDVRYFSADAVSGCDYEIDLEKSLTFDAKEFETVVALDVLEHVDRLHSAAGELFRIAKERVVIGLPNMGVLGHRIHFLYYGKLGTEKYDLRGEEEIDRHRWLTSYRDIVAFYRSIGERHGFKLESLGLEVGGGKIGRIVSWILLKAGMPLSGVLVTRVIGYFRRS